MLTSIGSAADAQLAISERPIAAANRRNIAPPSTLNPSPEPAMGLLLQSSWLQTRPNYAWLASPHFVVRRDVGDHHHESTARSHFSDAGGWGPGPCRYAQACGVRFRAARYQPAGRGERTAQGRAGTPGAGRRSIAPGTGGVRQVSAARYRPGQRSGA